MQMDNSVVYLFIGVFVIALTTLGFRYANYLPCEVALFGHSARAYRVGELIKFDDRTVGAQQWRWDFGDGSPLSNQKNPIHVYQDKGEYEVQLFVNNSCERSETIRIEEKKILLDSTKFPVFELPKTIVVGQILEVEDQTDNATTWEWRFGETASANATTQSAEYIYSNPGLKTVSLIVNGDMNYIKKKKINVLPLPDKEEPVTKIEYRKRDVREDLRRAPEGIFVQKEADDKPTIVPFITEGNFKTKIRVLATNKLTPDSFSQYFCDDDNPLIVANGRSTTFLDFSEKIKGTKINIKDLVLKRNAGSNCITTFDIEY